MDKINNIEIPKLISPDIIESVIENEEALSALFHLQEEECFLKKRSSRIARNSKMLKFVLCDIQIYLNDSKCRKEDVKEINTNDKSDIYINVSDISNKKMVENHEKEIKCIKEWLESIEVELENIKKILKEKDTRNWGTIKNK